LKKRSFLNYNDIDNFADKLWGDTMIQSRCFIKNSLYISIVVVVLNIILLARPLGRTPLFAEPASESVYYIMPSGNDNSPGTESQPWKTIQKACNTLVPGDTVYVKAGQYNEKITVNVSGTASGGYIVIRNYENR